MNVYSTIKMDDNIEEFPSEGELVMCTVKKVFNQGAMVYLDGYNKKEGLLHVTEISLRWVKNIRDYVKEDQKIVLKVINVNRERGHIDLSLRRVSDSERRLKLMDVKKKLREKKFMEFLAKNLNIEIEELYKKLDVLAEKFGTMYLGMEEISKDNEITKILDLDADTKEKLIQLINENIKPGVVKISGYLSIVCYEGNGVETIKECLRRALVKDTTNIAYIAAGSYKIDVFSDNYKTAEKILKETIQKVSDYAKEKKCECEFHRDKEKKT